jgi:anti-sigma regulatory factor (Ser/Thr protein kinase)
MSSARVSPAGCYVHEAAVYDSDEQLLQLVGECVQGAAAAGEPTIAALNDREAALVRSALGGPTDVTFLPELTRLERPATTIQRFTAILGELATQGATQIRLLNAVPHPGVGAPWDGWCRYEAASNHLLAHLPVWGLCLYDRRITPPHVLGDVERTHPRIATHGTHLPNPSYEDPRSFLLSLAPAPDPLQAQPPLVEVSNPIPAVARRAIQDAAGGTQLQRQDLENLLIGASEAVTNAILHGLPPITMKVWADNDRMIVTVHDHGDGPADPYVGLVPKSSTSSGQGGLGLWIVDQLLPVSYVRGDGFTIGLVGGRPLP